MWSHKDTCEHNTGVALHRANHFGYRNLFFWFLAQQSLSPPNTCANTTLIENHHWKVLCFWWDIISSFFCPFHSFSDDNSVLCSKCLISVSVWAESSSQNLLKPVSIWPNLTSAELRPYPWMCVTPPLTHWCIESTNRAHFCQSMLLHNCFMPKM